jgi:hypothetical protein
VRAFDAGDAVVLLAVTPALERWTLHPGTASLMREVLERLPHLPAAFVVADPAGTGRADAGWILGLSRHPSGATDLIVLDAAALTAPAVASARLPQRVLHELRCAWIPATDA